MSKKRIIVIEGADGSGKTTQIEALKKVYDGQFKFAKFPWYDSPSGEKVSKYLNGEFKEIEDIKKVENIMAISQLYTDNRVEVCEDDKYDRCI